MEKQFQQFHDASGLSAESEKRQVSTLFYCLGEDADNVLVSTNVAEDERKRYKDVMAKFDDHFKIRRTWYSNEQSSIREYNL